MTNSSNYQLLQEGPIAHDTTNVMCRKEVKILKWMAYHASIESIILDTAQTNASYEVYIE